MALKSRNGPGLHLCVAHVSRHPTGFCLPTRATVWDLVPMCSHHPQPELTLISEYDSDGATVRLTSFSNNPFNTCSLIKRSSFSFGALSLCNPVSQSSEGSVPLTTLGGLKPRRQAARHGVTPKASASHSLRCDVDNHDG